MSSRRSLLVRRRGISWLRNSVLLFIVVFVWLQLNFLSLRNSSDTGQEINDSYAAILSMVPSLLHKFLTPRPFNRSLSNLTIGNLFSKSSLNISEMKYFINRYNKEQTVINENIFGPLQNDSIVIVVQVHDRINYLRHLIVSLAQVTDIAQVLLIFSHDFYDEEINGLVQSIDFCKVIQIFYPFSIQTHPNEFPGEDPKDCPRNMKKELKCKNAMYPDHYGHYREAKFTQTKHHWWWKANRVFNELEIMKNYTGLVVLLEEDHYVAEDFLYVLKKMEQASKDSCRYCNMLSLGNYLKTYNYYSDSRKVEVTPWISSKHNMGMVFNRSTWVEIVGCAEFFCKYDDYNWDWSLQQVSQNCLKHKLHTMVVRAPRVFHIGECGVHHNKSNCLSTAIISKVQQVLKSAKKYLYPSYLTLSYTTVLKKAKLRKGNGGWGDKRDHILCLAMALKYV
ncbi:alpha-1,6-mannosyl-glycoprotein 2-beta-N-acetylglucosaminyltransferase isoform X2 [Agrilus planipennis]|uniref:Alpha-1,6-mannosyl-glycoprotein 2-beta-N-acetylglucosaminyltransferase n=1 Tax=Agrilus planipennis TaxID=224129 RepID=A0A1W4X888_AGRPL|nr:alpha-1,6-mannosyl-glycoprotein 2-beta-N-acetylglucosaminyltransferase isoform X2 [Agrilus planipennis]